MDELIRKENAGWLHIYSDDYSTEMGNSIKGKYLFFSKNRESLISILEKEITKHGFFYGKISLVDAKGDGSSVLCLYWKDESREQELSFRYIRRVHWKSDEETKNGIYSKSFGLEKEYLELFYSLPYLEGYKTIFNNYYRTKFHDNRISTNFDPDKIFENIINELIEFFSEEELSKFKNSSLSMLPIIEGHPKVTIEDIKKKIKSTH